MPLSGAAASAGLLRPWPGALDWRVALTLAATYASFGSGPAGAKAALDTLPPLVLVGVRGVVAGAVLVAWSLASGARCPSRHQWLASLVVGVLILALGAGGGTMGQRTVPSGVAGVMSALLPIFVAGLGLLLRPGGSDLDPFGVSLVVAGQLSWALGAELAPRVGLPEDPRLAAGAELLCGGAVLLAAAALMGDLGRLAPGAVSALSWLGLGWLTVTAVVGFTACCLVAGHRWDPRVRVEAEFGWRLQVLRTAAKRRGQQTASTAPKPDFRPGAAVKPRSRAAVRRGRRA